MNKRNRIFLTAFACFSFLLGHSQSDPCSKIRKGTFYFYPANSQQQYVIIRDDSTQQQINLKKKDTTFWKISWQKNCVFYLSFLRSSRPVTEKEKRFYRAHKVYNKVKQVADDHYTFTVSLDSPGSKTTMEDSIWFKPKPNRKPS
jgi:hypothetical protein